jgi:hypothetical protein
MMYYIQIAENDEREKAKFCERCMYENRGRCRGMIVPYFDTVAINNTFGQIAVETDKSMEEVIELMDKAKVRWAHISHPVKNSARVIHNQKIKNNETK